MFAKMKTGTKVLAGFGAAVMVTLLVGWFGYRGISQLRGHVEDIGAVKLPGVRGLNLIAKDGYALTFSEDQLLNGAFIAYDPATGDELKSPPALTAILLNRSST